MEERSLTNLETFFLLIGIICGTLAIGYQNIILGGISVMTLFFSVGSIIKRKMQEE